MTRRKRHDDFSFLIIECDVPNNVKVVDLKNTIEESRYEIKIKICVCELLKNVK